VTDATVDKISLTVDEEGIARLRMQDADNQNRFSLAFVDELRGHLDAIAADTRIKVVILSGLEDVFCAGGDREVLLGLAEGRLEPYDLELTRQLIELPVPVIAAMAGHAVGGGLVFGLACDLVVMGRESRYGCNFMDMGFTPGMGTTRLIQSAFGDYLSAEMMFGCQYFKGSKLEGKARVNAIVDRDKVEARAEKIAMRMADKPRKAITLLKRSLGLKRRRLFEEARTIESYMHEICFADPETQARIRENYND
jgi:polyketide biosynthesis enoyl-CoA hydratase PksI